MPDMDGFSMLVQLSHQPLVIFTTAYEQYAIKAFEENAIDYLLKPIEASRFSKSIDKLKNLSHNQAPLDFFKLKEMFETKNIAISSHSLRKTFGRQVWNNNGESDKALLYLSELFNHSSPAITKRYLGIRQEELDDIYMNL